jgi:hypothetical protein
MPFDHETTRLHREELDREIDTIRQEQVLAPPRSGEIGLVARARRRTGSVLIAAGVALRGSEAPMFGRESHALGRRG